MKKMLSVLLSLAIMTATPNTGLCVSKEEKHCEERISVSWQAVKETCKEVVNVIYDNAVLISAVVAGTTLTSVSAFNGVKNRTEINKILSDVNLNNRTKAIKVAKILLLGKYAITAETPAKSSTDAQADQENATDTTGEESTNTTTPDGAPAEEQVNTTEIPNNTSTDGQADQENATDTKGEELTNATTPDGAPAEEQVNTTEIPNNTSTDGQADQENAADVTKEGSTKTTETSTDKSAGKSNNTKENKANKSEKNQKRRHGMGRGF